MSATTEFDPAAPAPSGIAGRRDLASSVGPEARVAHSKLYSRFVGLMKLVLPMVALMLIALVIAWPHLNTADLRFRIGFAALQLSDSKDPSMINPRYVGTDKDNQPFSITADLARNLAGSGAEVELEMPKADITTEDGTWLVLTAKNGIFARTDKKLNLNGAVNLFHDSGYEFRTERADIDLAAGVATGNDPVEGQGPFGHLTANGFRLIDKGRTILFTGKSKLTLYPNAGKAVK
ncbi:MAG: LPS export ABC transporter periplasmic protein LptC [Magnetovibrio sp.]|nr:LPS export ABC transporter periplasmic protein LptC [Magnetovibrio sp.]